MKIETLKDLEKLVKLCRKLGVEAIECDGVRMDLGPSVPKATRSSSKSKKAINTSELEAPDRVDTDALTPEQLLYYSAIPHGDMEAS